MLVRRTLIITLLLMLVAPLLWSAATGQRALPVDGLSHARAAVAVIVPTNGMPKVGETVAVHASTASSVVVGLVDEVGNGTMALRDAVRSDNWTASVADVRGTVLAVFEGPFVRFLAGLHPLMTSTVIILLIITLVAIPLRVEETDEVTVHAPLGRHIKQFSDLGRG